MIKTLIPNKRNRSLDLIRFVAITLVLGRHTFHIFNDNTAQGIISKFFRIWQRIGWIGVEIFFVMSGYLIGSLIFNEINKTSKFNVKVFLIRRGFKIYPSYYIFIVITFLYYLFVHNEFNPNKLIADSLFIQNYIGGSWEHLWSLAVEEHFYLFFAFFSGLLCLKTGKINLYPYLTILIIFAVIALRFLNKDFQQSDIYKTHYRIDALLIGTLIAFYKLKNNSEMINGIFKTIFAIAIFAGALLWPVFFEQNAPETFLYGYLLMNIGFGLGLVLILENNYFSNINSRVLDLMAYIGRGSYNIYIWHMFVELTLFALINSLYPIPFFVAIPLYITISILIGLVITHYIENPILKLRNKLVPPTE